MTQEIVTNRLVLRRPDMSDASAITALINTLEVSRWLTRVPYPYGRADAQKFISRCADEFRDTFFITHEGALIGCVSIEEELGYWLGCDFWGRGFASEAAEAMVARHFDCTDAALTSGYFTENTASQRVLEKLAFRKAALVDARSLATCTSRPLQKMRLTHETWQAARCQERVG